MIAEVGALDNPLLSGCLHRDRGRVALLANDGAAFARRLAQTAACFQRTQNLCLIQQYGVLAAPGASAGFRDARMEAPSDSGRAHSRRPLGADARFGLMERRSDPPDTPSRSSSGRGHRTRSRRWSMTREHADDSA